MPRCERAFIFLQDHTVQRVFNCFFLEGGPGDEVQDFSKMAHRWSRDNTGVHFVFDSVGATTMPSSIASLRLVCTGQLHGSTRMPDTASSLEMHEKSQFIIARLHFE